VRLTDTAAALSYALETGGMLKTMQTLVKADDPTLSRDRLSWVQQNYLRADTMSRANARLVDAQSRILLVQPFSCRMVSEVPVGLSDKINLGTVYFSMPCGPLSYTHETSLLRSTKQ